jgi:hypothetical protein
VTTYTTVLDGYGDLALWRSEGESDPHPAAIANLYGSGNTAVTQAHFPDNGVVFRAAAAVLAPDEAVVEAAAARAWAEFHTADPAEFAAAPSRSRAIYLDQTRSVLTALRQHAEGSAS